MHNPKKLITIAVGLLSIALDGWAGQPDSLALQLVGDQEGAPLSIVRSESTATRPFGRLRLLAPRRSDVSDVRLGLKLQRSEGDITARAWTSDWIPVALRGGKAADLEVDFGVSLPDLAKDGGGILELGLLAARSSGKEWTSPATFRDTFRTRPLHLGLEKPCSLLESLLPVPGLRLDQGGFYCADVPVWEPTNCNPTGPSSCSTELCWYTAAIAEGDDPAEFAGNSSGESARLGAKPLGDCSFRACRYGGA